MTYLPHPGGVFVVAGGDVEVDDIHVALEYKKGDVWGEYTTPRSNRFVLTVYRFLRKSCHGNLINRLISNLFHIIV